MIVHLLAEAAEGRHAGDGQRGDPGDDGAHRHQADEPAELVEVLGPRGVEDAAAREEEQPLEDGVVEDVEEGADGGDDGQGPQGRRRPSSRGRGPRPWPGRCSRSGRSSCRRGAAWRRSASSIGCVPMKSVTAPIAAMTRPQVRPSKDGFPTGAMNRKVRISPKIPVLSMTPLSRALTGDGAIEWASGSQSWPRGKTPAFRPKPARRKAKKASERQAARRAELGGDLGQGLAEPVPVDEEGPGDDEEPGELHEDEVFRGVADVLLLPVLEADEEEGGDGHDLPGQGEAQRPGRRRSRARPCPG